MHNSGMAQFITNSGYVVLVDEIDLPIVERFTWQVEWKGRKTKKPRVYTKIGGRKHRKRVYLSRMLMGEPDCTVDHKNGDTLDNQRSNNLRLATRLQNAQNRMVLEQGTSRYKGVYKHLTRHGRPIVGKPWGAIIRANGKKNRLGFYADEATAARAYDAAAREHHGEFACLNFP